MFYYILLISLYFVVGAVFASINCAIHDTPTPPDMSEDDKNMFVLIVAFWVILFPIKFVWRLYKAIRTLLANGKID